MPDRPFEHHRILHHGGVTHGLQFPSRANLPTAYYGPQSGVGIALRTARRDGPLRVAVVGLGIGTVAAYAQPGDVYCLYEINPDVLEVAMEHFTFLSRTRATLQPVLGDARMSLARQPDQHFDLIVLDAFSGDAIPVHLLTSECFELYLRHLRGGGMIAVHISNQHLELAPVVMKLAEHFALDAIHIRSPAQPDMGQYEARWLLLCADRARLDPLRPAASPIEPRPDLRLWTDDDTSLFQILRDNRQ
jgi:spermidine synthase